MQYAKILNCCAGIIVCICFIACGRKTTGIDEYAVKINSIPCGYNDNKPAVDSVFSDDRVKTGNAIRTTKRTKAISE